MTAVQIHIFKKIVLFRLTSSHETEGKMSLTYSSYIKGFPKRQFAFINFLERTFFSKSSFSLFFGWQLFLLSDCVTLQSEKRFSVKKENSKCVIFSKIWFFLLGAIYSWLNIVSFRLEIRNPFPVFASHLGISRTSNEGQNFWAFGKYKYLKRTFSST